MAYDSKYDFIVYIDEAGDTGLKNVITNDKNGSSEWIILAATVVQAKREKQVIAWKKEIEARCTSRQARSFHFRKAKLNQQIEAATRASSYPLRHFVVCSNKKNIEKYSNNFASKRNTDLAGLIPSKSGWLYYWLLRLILERVGDFIEKKSMEYYGESRKARLEFSKNGGVRYDELLGYLQLLREQHMTNGHFLKTGCINWDSFDLNEVGIYNHHTRAGLIFPDIVASAFYQACDKIERGKPVEPRPALVLKPRMASRRKGSERIYREYGVKLMPGPQKILIDSDQKQVFKDYGYDIK